MKIYKVIHEFSSNGKIKRYETIYGDIIAAKRDKDLFGAGDTEGWIIELKMVKETKEFVPSKTIEIW